MLILSAEWRSSMCANSCARTTASSFLFGNYKSSTALLELSQEEFHWEIQIFVNQFLRQCAESSIELLPFCRRLRNNLTETEFSSAFQNILDQAFVDHFYTSEIQNTLPA